jgi:hypothetical protein
MADTIYEIYKLDKHKTGSMTKLGTQRANTPAHALVKFTLASPRHKNSNWYVVLPHTTRARYTMQYKY